MKVETLVQLLNADFYTGVPDSQLKALCDYLMDTYGVDGKHHLIAANEGNAAAIAAGYHLATGKVPVVYMQNSGEGNIINPAASLLNDRVYGIPVIFIVGWRGEPGVHDEPQHIYQGEVTVKLLEDMEIETFIIGKETTQQELANALERFHVCLEAGKDAAFVVRKGALTYEGKTEYRNDYPMTREEIIQHVLRYSGEDPIVSTTGKASRELFEARQAQGQDHSRDFLTVGSMGHSSSIALGIALQKPETRIWCVDGDGAALMHMGAMAVIGAQRPKNFVHVLINNGAHESVGGMPTVASGMDFTAIAKACGYPNAISVSTPEELDCALEQAAKGEELCLVEAKCAIGARANLGRPTTSAKDNKQLFMAHLSGKN